MSRVRAVAVLGAGLGLAGWTGLVAPTLSAAEGLDCPRERIEVSERKGQPFARCVGSAEAATASAPSAGAALSLGGKADLNRMSAEDFRLLPGFGRRLAGSVIAERARLGRFQSWQEVDEVPGMGPAKLRALKDLAEIRE